jgi:hypothetical protein
MTQALAATVLVVSAASAAQAVAYGGPREQNIAAYAPNNHNVFKNPYETAPSPGYISHPSLNARAPLRPGALSRMRGQIVDDMVNPFNAYSGPSRGRRFYVRDAEAEISQAKIMEAIQQNPELAAAVAKMGPGAAVQILTDAQMKAQGGAPSPLHVRDAEADAEADPVWMMLGRLAAKGITRGVKAAIHKKQGKRDAFPEADFDFEDGLIYAREAEAEESMGMGELMKRDPFWMMLGRLAAKGITHGVKAAIHKKQGKRDAFPDFEEEGIFAREAEAEAEAEADAEFENFDYDI